MLNKIPIQDYILLKKLMKKYGVNFVSNFIKEKKYETTEWEDSEIITGWSRTEFYSLKNIMKKNNFKQIEIALAILKKEIITEK